MVRNFRLLALSALMLSACDDAHLRFDEVVRFGEDAAVDAAIGIDSGEVLADASPIDAQTDDAQTDAANNNLDGGDIDAEPSIDLGIADSGIDCTDPRFARLCRDLGVRDFGVVDVDLGVLLCLDRFDPTCDGGIDAFVPPDGCVATGPEVCDGVDNDCDGVIDESSTDSRQLVPRYRDSDLDGHGAAHRDAIGGYEFCDFQAEPSMQCPLADGYADDARDCDDRNSGVSPDDVEVCDGVDNDCDGLVDEGSDLCDAGEACESGSGTCVACAEFTTLPTVIETPTVICANSGVISVPTTSVVLPASEGGSLTIEAGNTLAFADGRELFMRSDLHVRGSRENPVVFRSASPTPTRTSWLGVRLDPAEQTRIRIVGLEARNMERGFYDFSGSTNFSDFRVFDSTFENNTEVFYFNQTPLRVLDTTFADNTHVALQTAVFYAGRSTFRGNESLTSQYLYGVVFADSVVRDNRSVATFHMGNVRMCRTLVEDNDVLTPPGPSPRVGGLITHSTFSRNGGPILHQVEDLQIENSTLCDNSPHDIQTTTTSNLDARNNYWCTTDIDAIRSRIYDLYDDATLGRVYFEPFLTAPHPDAPEPTPLP